MAEALPLRKLIIPAKDFRDGAPSYCAHASHTVIPRSGLCDEESALDSSNARSMKCRFLATLEMTVAVCVGCVEMSPLLWHRTAPFMRPDHILNGFGYRSQIYRAAVTD